MWQMCSGCVESTGIGVSRSSSVLSHQFLFKKILRHLLGTTKLYKEKNKCIREKMGAQNMVKEIKQYQKKWHNTYRGWTQMEYQNRHYNIDRKK
jgi:hypothetical protein